MRLTCPNCRAQYEVDAAAIPARGRDVQCSSCGHGWFQRSDGIEAATATAPPAGSSTQQDSPGPAPVPKASPAPNPDFIAAPDAAGDRVSARVPPQRELDPAIAEVLRAEAAREARQRRKETAELVEEQQELALAQTTQTPQATSDDAAGAKSTGLGPAPASFAQATRAQVPRRDLLPDIEEINSSLRAKSAAKARAAQALTPEEIEDRRRRGRGFRLGFSAVLLIALFALLTYAYASQIIAQVPALEPALSAYVSQMNAARVWIDAQLTMGSMVLDAILSTIGG